ncbi:YheU family protein [Congregibacter sp.]|uniref:YheU family protein n=1 Tax=Congregibacter sp. TaxID=2744308 RepID=UPI003F6B1BB1
MAAFVKVPAERVPEKQLHALLEEFASRDGTDYGARETTMEERVKRLLAQLRAEKIQLLFDVDSEQWDLLAADDARRLLDGAAES